MITIIFIFHFFKKNPNYKGWAAPIADLFRPLRPEMLKELIQGKQWDGMIERNVLF
jgi:hypothetical protein